MNSNFIEFHNYFKKYKAKTVLKNVNLQLEEGKVYGIIGRNGSGKTLLLKAISGLINSTSGFVKVQNKIIGKDIDFPDDIGVLIETPGFLPNMSGFNNLKILAKIRNKIDDSKIKDTISFVGLDPLDTKPVKKYSLGMRQRLGIAQAIMEEPKILLLDEPMNGLDKSGVKDIREYILKLREKGITILLTSHNSEDIEILCDSVYEMDEGTIEKIR